MVWDDSRASKGESTLSVLGKQKADKSVERDLQGGASGDEMEVDALEGEEVHWREKVLGKVKAKNDDYDHHHSDEEERGRSWPRK